MPIKPDQFVGIDIVPSLAKFEAYLKRLPPAVQDAVVDAVSKALIDILQSTQPPPKRVTRRAAYGTPFFSEKQRHWFFAALDSGEISVPYRRTQALRRGWRQIGHGIKSIVANETPGAEFVVGDEHQSRHEAMVGWQKTSATIKEHTPRLEKVAVAEAQRAMDKVPEPK